MHARHYLHLRLLPLVLGAIAFEIAWYLFARRRAYPWREMLASIGVYFVRLPERLLRPLTVLPLAFLAWSYRLVTVPLHSVWGWVALFFGVEIAYYWMHRFSHEVRWLWASHLVHHTPEQIHLASAFRLGATELLSGGWLFYFPLYLLGFNPLAVSGMLAINLFYQFWLHTDLVGRLGPLEWIFNTPAHHRVHHASNGEYLDRNYGGILIVWDRLFGTFAEERPEAPIVYGLVHPVGSLNPVTIAFHEWVQIARDVSRAGSWRERLTQLFGRPGASLSESAASRRAPDSGDGSGLKMLYKTLLCAGAVSSLLCFSPPAPAQTRKPDVIVILADDLGYGDTGVYGSKIAKTPNIDALAASGIRFTDGYVTNPVCAPSRAGLMTGRYQQRFGYEFNPVGRDRTGGMSLHEITLAQIMKSAGYATGAIGKWHLGQPAGYYPTDRGFDYFFGMAGGGSDYIIDPAPGDEFIAKGRGGKEMDITVPAAGLSAMPDGDRLKALLERMRARQPITRDGKVVRVDEYLTDAFTKEAVDFINRNQSHPFFLYLAQHAPHVPLQAPQKYIDRFRDVKDPGKRVYAAMVSSLDDSVGAVIATLKKDGLYDNTTVIFLSDNGCAGYAYGACSNAPLSGYKRWLAEGGVRIPYIVSWPGHLPAGQVDHRQVSSLDILPTAAALAHAKLPSDRVYDGVSLLPFLDGENNGIPNPKLYWRDGTDFAMRDIDLKLWICNVAPSGTAATKKPYRELKESDEDLDVMKSGRQKSKFVVPTIGPGGQHVMLYNLADDIGELHNIAATHPSEVAHMEAEIASWNKTLVKPQWPQSKHSTVDFDGQNLELFY